MPGQRDPVDVALELHSRGFTATHAEAMTLVTENPGAVEFLLGLTNIDREMRDPRDRAVGDDW